MMKITRVLRSINSKSLESLKKTVEEKISETPQYLSTVKNERNKMITTLNEWYLKVTGTKEVDADSLKKTMKATIAEAPQYLKSVKEEKKKIVYDKIANLNKWYVKIIGLDEVKLYQDRVTALQEQLLKTQEKRREVSKQLNEVRQRSVDIQNQIQHIDRKEKFDVYCQLIKEEREIVTLERSVLNTFQEYDQTERELFTAFANAIRDSHEKQRAQLEYTKYLGLILSIAGSFLAFVYTTYKKHDLKMFIDEKLSTLELSGSSEPLVHNVIEANEKTMREVIKNRDALQQVINSTKTSESLVKEVLQNRETLNRVVRFLNNEGMRERHTAGILTSETEQGAMTDLQMNVVKYVGGILVFAFLLKLFSS
nr:uncharacterized protein LOC111507579 [Leptinotarsa decemlineata]